MLQTEPNWDGFIKFITRDKVFREKIDEAGIYFSFFIVESILLRDPKFFYQAWSEFIRHGGVTEEEKFKWGVKAEEFGLPIEYVNCFFT